MNEPYVLEETDNYAVVFKPAKMHSEILREFTRRHIEPSVRGTKDLDKEVSNKTILEWFYENNSFNKEIKLMHRLDFETNGLVLFAKKEKSFLFFKDLQDKGEFVKEYSAVCAPADNAVVMEGFPDNNSAILSSWPKQSFEVGENSFEIKSYFRPFGPGRKQVRPVIEDGKKHKEIAKDKGGFYTTEIIAKNDNIFTLRIKRGFRHQIRCHLCWAGFPIKNDPLYSPCAESALSGELALRSHALFFVDPANGECREYRIKALRNN
ncbi:MAG: pseudouridine synthase [Treponema sp.]|nr:pseudouridine synthase [Treponema sp.]MCL2237290.1 pseudouridine synthase [Treponema sp.]